MKISIQVNEGPYQHQSADTAYQFAKAAIEKGSNPSLSTSSQFKKSHKAIFIHTFLFLEGFMNKCFILPYSILLNNV